MKIRSNEAVVSLLKRSNFGKFGELCGDEFIDRDASEVYVKKVLQILEDEGKASQPHDVRSRA